MIGQEDLEVRFNYHPPRDAETAEIHGMLRDSCLVLAGIVDRFVPDGREKSLAITKIEEAMMWANAAIARASENRAPQEREG